MSSSEMMGVETPENLNENEITEGNDGVEGTFLEKKAKKQFRKQN